MVQSRQCRLFAIDRSPDGADRPLFAGLRQNLQQGRIEQLACGCIMNLYQIEALAAQVAKTAFQALSHRIGADGILAEGADLGGDMDFGLPQSL